MVTDLVSSLYVNHISKITCKCLGEVYEFHHLRVARALFYNVTCIIWVARLSLQATKSPVQNNRLLAWMNRSIPEFVDLAGRLS
jgi:hypothetical protein